MVSGSRGLPRFPPPPSARRGSVGSRNDSSSHTVRVGLVQSRCAATPEDNLRAALDGVRRAAMKGAGLVCLQELFRTRYFCQVEDAALFDPSPFASSNKVPSCRLSPSLAISINTSSRSAGGISPFSNAVNSPPRGSMLPVALIA